MVQKLRPWKTVIYLNLDCERSIYRQIADGIIEEIKRGRLVPGTALPGTRQLAEDLKVNRKTVVLAFDELIAEGWLTTAYKKGTLVSERRHDSELNILELVSNNLFKNYSPNYSPIP